LIERGKRPESISLVVRGTVQMTRDRRLLGELGPGSVVGSALILSGAPAEVDAVAAEPVRTVCWDVGTLERYLNAHPETRTVLQRHLAHDLTGKLERLGRDVLGIDRAG
jgi:CRP-like cAMP-binding protein